ncbi:MAG: methionine--tRNA ligase subunit beta [Candidatus Nealsonbacteria bacterium CG23_combo_of_CG06-09_8_20_14_all_36_12]|uniref:Methionine--tRNA ligase n=2 Tax=Candidatus Nealsoniibacteriota TaxID=1817911 RepID=A0A2H0TMF1_9BACT|nr:MAG: methionine--tRNA ligase subunit beta [Candidatus Nealsonbacteria bacterium CG23_combo_of_CG06-09_8_20_14_all_36_12]PIR72746.1 MAG: methionine--tRNA ligase subunit beta [Candidatus Nealsonbacteria bacterium CG10_big_fil_rev_8_21_14_0_10_36_23]
MITFEDFKKLEIRIGKVLSVEKVEESDKLLKLEIDLGKEKRQIVVGMAEFFEPEYFLNKELLVFVNLEPRKFKGIESQGMVLAVDVNKKPVLLVPEKEVPPGSIIK